MNETKIKFADGATEYVDVLRAYDAANECIDHIFMEILTVDGESGTWDAIIQKTRDACYYLIDLIQDEEEGYFYYKKGSFINLTASQYEGGRLSICMVYYKGDKYTWVFEIDNVKGATLWMNEGDAVDGIEEMIVDELSLPLKILYESY